MLGDRLRADTNLLFNATDDPDFKAVGSVDVENAVALAFKNRPELIAAEKAIDQSEIQHRFAKNQRLPKLDVDLSFTTLGIKGRRDATADRVVTQGTTTFVIPGSSAVNEGFNEIFSVVYGKLP